VPDVPNGLSPIQPFIHFFSSAVSCGTVLTSRKVVGSKLDEVIGFVIDVILPGAIWS
jgi:hypothetical protein